MKTIIKLGKVDYNNTGRKENMVTLEVNLSEASKGKRFSMSGNVWNRIHTDIIAGGQMCDEIGWMFPENKTVQRLLQIWEKYHLNDMNAGTEKQEQALINQFGNIPDYDTTIAYLKSINLYEDNGYKYGSAWLFRAIPDDVIKEIEDIINEQS